MLRLGTLVFSMTIVILATSPVTDVCHLFNIVIAVLYCISAPAAPLLFFLRLRAVFSRNKRVTYVFGFFWVAVFAMSLFYLFQRPFLLHNTNPGKPTVCIVSSVDFSPVTAALPIGTTLLFDSLALCAISWKLMTNTHKDMNFHQCTKTLILGKYLPTFSRMLLQDTQLYYMATFPLSVATMIVTILSTVYHVVPPSFAFVFAIPNNAVINMMACRVFRMTKLHLNDVENSPVVTRDMIAAFNRVEGRPENGA
ncbi:hypothetical protein BJ165DRAFT_1441016 [Panaeolus papilionaceus]|nr:hypothetical protein BJ165DRAFT_1441016 [Panaeolus papilionaceus]